MANLPSCMICSEIYNTLDYRPFVLAQCFHTICEECYNNLSTSGVIECPKDRVQSLHDPATTRINYELLDQIERLEVKCDDCGRPATYVCESCIVFRCTRCKPHSCLIPNVLDLAEINLSALLLEKITIERRLRLDTSRQHYSVSRTNAELVIMLRNETKGGDIDAKCDMHPSLPGEFLDTEDLRIKCDTCKRQHSRGGDFLPLGQALDSVRSRLEDKLRQFDSFNIPPLLLKDLKSSNVAHLLRIFRLLNSEKVFIPYCPFCLKRLTNATALRYPCEQAHLICETCDPKDSVTKCCYDSQEYRRDTLHSVNLERLYTSNPVCPICMVNKELKVLQCDHSFCERCLSDLNKCPICSETTSASSAGSLRPETFLADVANLNCKNDSRPAVVISKQTCQLFCFECSQEERITKVHSFETLPGLVSQYLERMISQYMESITGRQSPNDDSQGKINELKEYITQLPAASQELKELLARYPNIKPKKQALLLHYLKTDLTNCDVDGLEECVGWRIPRITIPEFKLAMRFSDVLPPLFRQEEDVRPTRNPWRVNLEKGQVELVGLNVFSPVQLHGIVMATAYGPSTTAVLQYFQIHSAVHFQEFGEALMYSHNCDELFSHERNDALTGPESYKVIMFERPFDLIDNTPYMLKLKLQGSQHFYRGNPHTLDEAKIVTTADVTFYFRGALCVTGEFVDGLNQLTGPLLGLVYK